MASAGAGRALDWPEAPSSSRRTVKVKTLDELMNPFGKDESSIVVGAGGFIGSQDWIKAALLLKCVHRDPRKMRHVAYDGGAGALTGLVGGARGAHGGI